MNLDSLLVPVFLLALAIVIYAVILGWAMDRVLRFLEVKERRDAEMPKMIARHMRDAIQSAPVRPARDERAVQAIARWERK